MTSCQHLTPTSHSPSRGSGQPPPEVRGGTRGNRNAWETGATTRGYEVSEDGRRVSQLVRLTESTPSSRKSFHGLSDTTTSDLHKSQPTPTYSDKPWGSPSPVLSLPYTTSAPSAYSSRGLPRRLPASRPFSAHRAHPSVIRRPVLRTPIDFIE